MKYHSPNSPIRQFTNSSCWAHQDSNLEPADYEPAALTIELWARPQCNATSQMERSGIAPSARMYNRHSMNSDLERLIALQRLDSAADAARRRLADEPERQK